jgi:hypothetical protein
MSDWHPQIYRLGEIRSLPGSDFLEITVVMNEYPVIMKKGQYKEGDLVSFLPYDTVVPDTEFFNFLAPPPKKDNDGNISLNHLLLWVKFQKNTEPLKPKKFVEHILRVSLSMPLLE